MIINNFKPSLSLTEKDLYVETCKTMAEKGPRDDEDVSDSEHSMSHQEGSTMKPEYTRWNSQLPPDGHIINDKFRLTGQIPSTLNEINQILKRSPTLKPLFWDEANQIDSESSGLQSKALEKLDKVVKDFFSDGPDAASVNRGSSEICDERTETDSTGWSNSCVHATTHWQINTVEFRHACRYPCPSICLASGA
ncbi:hypothetical protein BDV33DRAFT_198395 [Aspergillus novoparasiticus]|uniref:Uncharacterized protein n=1 Tax=Aspergillus novoparasiticus TaxID=986946 RepID=A0A5N6F6G6_9EURO|nr:hypothetical protein BDV33DRAFT_198395 [Aspergillus novoparasiticus]